MANLSKKRSITSKKDTSKKNKLPNHLQSMVDKASKTDSGRRNLADLIGAAYYRNTKGEIVKRRKK